jgi:hypothetical protein
MDQLVVERLERDWRTKLDIWPDGKVEGNPIKSDNERLPTNKLRKKTQPRTPPSLEISSVAKARYFTGSSYGKGIAEWRKMEPDKWINSPSNILGMCTTRDPMKPNSSKRKMGSLIILLGLECHMFETEEQTFPASYAN